MRLISKLILLKDIRSKSAFLKSAISFYGVQAPPGLKGAGWAMGEGGVWGTGAAGGSPLITTTLIMVSGVLFSLFNYPEQLLGMHWLID